MNRSDVFNEIAALQDPDEILRVIAAAEPVSRPTSAATRDTTAPSTPEEQALFEIWREALRRETLGIHESFFEIGGNSISGVQVMARVQRVFGKDVPLRVLFAAPTIARLARAIAEEQGALAPAWPALGPRRGGRPARASFAQQRLWFVAELRPQNPAYAVAAALRVRGTLDVNALEWALNAIVARHEVLRTRFEMTGDGLCQMVTPTWTLELREHDLRAAPAHAWRRHAQEEALRPFELSRLPLLRARLFRTDEHEWLLCLVLHHIVADGWSLGVLESELCRLYAARIQGREADLAKCV